jgi:hypothetical protein
MTDFKRAVYEESVNYFRSQRRKTITRQYRATANTIDTMHPVINLISGMLVKIKLGSIRHANVGRTLKCIRK